MIKKYAFLFFSAFILLKTGVFAMATETEEPRTRYMSVFRQIVRFHEFLSAAQDDIPNFQKENLKADQTIATNLLTYGDKLLNGEITGDFFFQKLILGPRLEYLFERTKLAKSLSCAPSDSNFLKYIQKYRKEFVDEGNEYAIARNLERYQFLNLLCFSMFKILRRDELSDMTVKLLRASPKLWPLLKDETHDLGHPDEAGGYAIVKAYLENLGEENFFDVVLSPPARAVSKIAKKVVCPLWEQEKLFNDAALYEAHFKKIVIIRTEFRFPLKDPLIRQTPFECGLWESDLPYPSFLQPASELAETEKSIPLEPSFFDTFPFEELEEKEEEISIPDSIEKVVESTEGTVGAASSSGSTSSCSSEISSSISSSSTDFIMPSGIRKFHELIPSSPYEVRELKKKDQSFIDSVFDAREFKNITCGDFETFWIKQGGRVVGSHGGSHRLLVGPKGDSLSGTYTHGRGQTYTPKTIKYLRAALWYIGCRPSK